jgi:hypothetical protein
MEEYLSMWTIYDHPRDHPEVFVARRWEVRDEPTPTSELMISGDLEYIREQMRARGLYCLERSPDDDPKIIETWL